MPKVRKAPRGEREKAARKLARKFAPYDLRHAFAHRLRTAGIDPMMDATLLGHRDLTMVHRVNGHWIKATDQLRNALAFAAARQV